MVNSDQNVEFSPILAGMRLVSNSQILMKSEILSTQNTMNILDDISCKQSQIVKVDNDEIYIFQGEREFLKTVPVLSQKDFILISLFCVQDLERNPGFTLFYVFRLKGFTEIFTFMRQVLKETTSIATIFPSACWYEREIQDGFGIEFVDAFDKRRLFLHEAYHDNFHPLLKSFKNGKIQAIESPKETYTFKQVEGEGIYQIPVGPVHAGIIEPGHFRFSVIGEPIFNLEIRLFYKHRGIEKLAEGKSPLECVSLAEAISGDESAVNATGFCMAVEQIYNIKVPERAEYLRAVMLELERIYSLLGDLAGMAVDIGFALIASPFLILKEEVLRQNEKLTGSRFLRRIMVPGGLNKDLSDTFLKGLPVFLKNFSHMFEQAFERAMSSSSLIDRFATTGIIKRDLIQPLNLTGPLAKASGSLADTRLDKPYGAYKHFAPKLSIRKKGDVLSRFAVKADEIRSSVDLILRFVEKMPDGPICTEDNHNTGNQASGYSFALTEAPRGQNLHWVYLKNGIVDRYKVRTASFCNWQAIEHAVIENIVPDFPLINKSLNLSYAGTDL